MTHRYNVSPGPQKICRKLKLVSIFGDVSENVLTLAKSLHETQYGKRESKPQLLPTDSCGQEYNNITEVTLVNF